jgi:hypothetical protein
MRIIIQFFINSHAIAPFSYPKELIIDIHSILSQYSPLYCRDFDEGIRQLSYVSSNFPKVITFFRQVLSTGMHEVDLDNFDSELISTIIRTINLAQSLEIPLSHSLNNLYDNLNKSTLTYHACIQILEVQQKNLYMYKFPKGQCYQTQSDYNDLAKLSDHQINSIYQHITISAIKEYLECPNHDDFMQMLLSCNFNEHKKHLLGMAKQIKIQQKTKPKPVNKPSIFGGFTNYFSNISTSKQTKQEDNSNKIRIINTTNRIKVLKVLSNYTICSVPDLTFLKYINNPHEDIPQYLHHLNNINNSIKWYLQENILSDLNSIIKQTGIPLKSQDILNCFYKFKNSGCNIFLELIKEQWELFVTILVVTERNNKNSFNWLKSLIEDIKHENYSKKQVTVSIRQWNDDQPKTDKILNILVRFYKIHPYDIKTLDMDEETRDKFYSALGMKPGSLTKRAMK